MSSVLSSKTNGFLFTWKVENINVSFCKESITSPKFVTYKLENCSWVMSLHPNLTRSGFNVNLRLTDSLELTDEIEVVITLTVVVSNGKEFVLQEKEYFSFEVDGALEEIASFVGFSYSEKTLVFNCHMDLASSRVPFIHCIAHTHIGSEKRSCIWKVRNFANLLPDKQKKYTLFSTAPQSPKIELLGTLFNKSEFLIDVRVESEKRIFIVGKISVLTPQGELKCSNVTGFLVEKDDLPFSEEMVINLSSIINQSVVLNFLHNGDLYLLCEFRFSKGRIHSQIDESNYLIKEHSDLLNGRFINLTTENSASNTNTTETKEISTPNTKDAGCSAEANRTPKPLNTSTTETEKISTPTIEDTKCRTEANEISKALNASTNETGKISTPNTEDTKCNTETKKTPQTLKEDLRKFYLQKNHCDVIFQIGTEILPAHKSILCSRSPVFNAMFDSDMKESANKKVEIVDMDVDTLDQFLLFLYSETLEDLTWDRASKLLYAANKYQVESLKVECTSFLMSSISTANVCEALKLSDLYQDEKLRSVCQNLIIENEAQIFSSKEWESLTVENPLLSAKTLQNHFAMKK